MRFAFIADTPDWACHRQGMGLVKYGATAEHSWSLFHAEPCDFTAERLRSYDAVRVASAPRFLQLLQEGVIPVEHAKPGQKLICSLASFSDVDRVRNRLRPHVDIIDAFAIVDQRLVEHCAGYGKPILPYIDRTDEETFPLRELPDKHRRRHGALRAGWAGSVLFWNRIKHADILETACLEAGVEYVRQDRELDGTKNETEMREWYYDLDLYLSANDTDTPTPVSQLEAASCGVPIVTTRCGILWPLLEPWQVIERAAVHASIVRCLREAVSIGREELLMRGRAFALRHGHFLHWHHGVAEQHTLDVAALCRGVP